MKTEYNEPDFLTQYVWLYGTDLMTNFEKLGYKTISVREKAATSSETMKRILLERFGAENDPHVVEALSEGHEVFKEAVRNRILRDHPEIVARCPKCNRVVRTPRAKQCMWCQHDWH